MQAARTGKFCYYIRMGTGRGKSSRVRTATRATTKPLTTYDAAKWEMFVHENGLEKLNLYKYYLGHNAQHVYTCDERTRIIQELFIDLVEAGALTLPSGYKAEDFELKRVKAPDEVFGDEIEISTTKNKNKSVRTPSRIDNFMKMGGNYYTRGRLVGHYIPFLLEDFAQALNYLVGTSKRRPKNARESFNAIWDDLDLDS